MRLHCRKDNENCWAKLILIGELLQRTFSLKGTVFGLGISWSLRSTVLHAAPTTNGRRPQALFVLSTPLCLSPSPLRPQQQPLFSAFVPSHSDYFFQQSRAGGTFDSFGESYGPKFQSKNVHADYIPFFFWGKRILQHFRDEFFNNENNFDLSINLSILYVLLLVEEECQTLLRVSLGLLIGEKAIRSSRWLKHPFATWKTCARRTFRCTKCKRESKGNTDDISDCQCIREGCSREIRCRQRKSIQQKEREGERKRETIGARWRQLITQALCLRLVYTVRLQRLIEFSDWRSADFG